MKRKLIIGVVLVVVAASLSGCDKLHELDNTSRAVKQQQQQITRLQKTVWKLQEQVSTLQIDQARLLANTVSPNSSVAYLTPSDGGYSVVSTSMGSLTVQIVNIRSYANGAKVTLKFGNPLAANITGLQFVVQWGSVGKNGLPVASSAKTKTITSVKTLRSGTWTAVSLVLAGVDPSKIGFIRIQNVVATSITLRKR